MATCRERNATIPAISRDKLYYRLIGPKSVAEKAMTIPLIEGCPRSQQYLLVPIINESVGAQIQMQDKIRAQIQIQI